VKAYRECKVEYRWNPTIFCEDDEKVARLKEIIETKLSQAERTIILLYAETQSYRKLGLMLRLSHMTCRAEVLRIRDKILTEYNKDGNIH
jgi:DNA-directed RNA polymerase specialized sigma24 family protein